MDVLQLLDNELRTKGNWSLEEKARYLFIRSCQLFSCDERYYNSIFRKMYGRKKEIEEIELKEIDLRNVTDFLVVSKSYSSYVYKPLLEELLNIETYVYDDPACASYVYNSFEVDKKKYNVQAILNCDIDRIKMGLRIKEYYNPDITESLNISRLKEIDKKIGYIKDEYFKEKLLRIINNLEDEYYKITEKRKEDDEFSYFLFQIAKIKEIFDKINTFKQYSEAFYCVDYLVDKFFDKRYCSIDGRYCYIFRKNNLLDITSNGDWNFIDIFDTNYRGEKFSFVLEPVDGKYEFHEIPVSEGEYYKKELLKESDFRK